MSSTTIEPLIGGVTLSAFLEQEWAEHRRVLEETLRNVEGAFAASLRMIEASLRGPGKLLLFGNGGSAADALHIAAELVVKYSMNRAALPAIALSGDPCVLTACGNDFGFSAVFARQIEALGREGDVALGISTSGRSANVVNGLREARRKGIAAVGLSSGDGGDMAEICDALILVPSGVTARVQEMHTMIGHMLCKALEYRLGFTEQMARRPDR